MKQKKKKNPVQFDHVNEERQTETPIYREKQLNNYEINF